MTNTAELKEPRAEDLALLLDAVRQRLVHMAQPDTPTDGMPARILECVAALDQLHAAALHEVARLRDQNMDMATLRLSLKQARLELERVSARRRPPLGADTSQQPQRSGRVLFFERLGYALKLASARKHDFAVLYLNLEGLDSLSNNSARGRDSAREMLDIIASRLSRSVREEDLVSQMADGEFACLLADLPSRAQLNLLAGKLSEAVSAPVKVGRQMLRLRPSIGIATAPEDGSTCETLINSAIAAMSDSRNLQLGHAFFSGGERQPERQRSLM